MFFVISDFPNLFYNPSAPEQVVQDHGRAAGDGPSAGPSLA